MGISIDLYKYDFGRLLDHLMTFEGIDDREKLKEILLDFGEVIDGKYILLNNEHYEDGNCYYNLSAVIDAVFKTENSFDAFLYDAEKSGKERMVSYVDIDDIADKYNIEQNDDYEWVKKELF